MSFRLDQAEWSRIERLVVEAEALEYQAGSAIKTILDAMQDEGVAERHREGLGDRYPIFCGTWVRSGEETFRINRRRDEVVLFWNSLRVALADQFGGFAVPDESSRAEMREFVFTEGGEPQDAFWRGVKGQPVRGPARIWCMVAYANALASPAPRQGHTKQTPDWVSGVLGKENLRTLLPYDASSDDIALWQGPARPERLQLLRCYAAVRLLRRYGPAEWQRARADGLMLGDPDLLQRLSLLLTRGTEQAFAVEVSLLMRILVGRYLNGASSLSVIERDMLKEGIAYVLKQQTDRDGSWNVSEGATSPVLNKYSPLLHVLDLDTEVLGEMGKGIVRACEKTLRSARSELSVREADYRSEDKGAVASLADAIVSALSIGAMVYDRLKDILSDEILQKRGAGIGHAQLRLSDIANGLRFRDSIERGIIVPWRERSSKRPGAILVYGPPGTGKTTVAAIIASELNATTDDHEPVTDRWRFLCLTPADFARKGSQGIVSCAEELFGELRRARRCVVLLDEMEEFLRVRGPGADRESRLVTTAFLPLLQEAVESREIILVVATNFVGSIDAAVTREGRFDLILPLGPPDRSARREVLKHCSWYPDVVERLSKGGKGWIGVDEFDDEVAKYSMGYARAELEGFLGQLWRRIKPEVKERGDAKILGDVPTLRRELWRVRADRVPMALSGRAGCDWRTFQDEAARYRRTAIGVSEDGDEGYWKEPEFPL